MVPLPDQYRGQHHYSDEEASIKYAESVKSQIAKLEAEGRRLAAFICEPYFVESGVHPPTSQYYQQVYRWEMSHFFLAVSYFFLIFQCSESSWWSGYRGWGIVQKKIPFSKNSFSESDRSWPDWRAHVGLPKLWSGPRYCHHWTFHVQRLSYGCCDMFQVGDKAFKSIF